MAIHKDKELTDAQIVAMTVPELCELLDEYDAEDVRDAIQAEMAERGITRDDLIRMMNRKPH